jgi:hypothetical protein
MDLLTLTRLFAWAGLIIGLLGLLLRIKDILNRPFKSDLSRPRGDARRGVLYAFTLGMAPWEKESTRQHWIAYIRGILFHVGVFLAFGVFIFSAWIGAWPAWVTIPAILLTAAGALFGLAGIWMRLRGANERVLSVPDDYFSVLLTSLFAGLAAVVLAAPTWLPVFYILTGLLGIYIPLSKIRHCAYFFYSKFFFGRGFGHRGVIGQPQGPYAK